jgi:hypothetical protein
VTLDRLVFQSDIDETTRRRWLSFSNTLVLPGLNIYESLGIDDPEKTKWHDFVFRARGRDLRGAIFDLANLPKVDFDGADLRGASLYLAVLQGASLDHAQLQGTSLFAHLQGASLMEVQLQGGSLLGVQLEGASLQDAQLQGADLEGAQLQGAALGGAQLQGASLKNAQLQGASIELAHLEGAMLDGARLQGASLKETKLQGASFERAVLEATDFSEAFLWRTNRPIPPSKVLAIQTSGRETWLPLWSDDDLQNRRSAPESAYQFLQKMIESVPSDDLREKALTRIQIFDCLNLDKTLASCEPSEMPPPEAVVWRKVLEAASVDEKNYVLALTKVLEQLICSGDQDAIYVVRGRGFQFRLAAAGPAAIRLIDNLLNKDSKDCPLFAPLTDADRAKLIEIKQDVNKAGK